MGKRRPEKANIENIKPLKETGASKVSSLPNLDSCSIMKTRSGKARTSEAKDDNLSPDKHPPVGVGSSCTVLMHDISNSLETVVEVEVPYELGVNKETDASPASGHSGHTPEKERGASASPTAVIHSEATPTANLKVLCDAVDHDESLSSEPQALKILRGDEPVTPTSNLKMLITAASPEIRNLELSKSRLFVDEDDDDEQWEDDETSKKVSKSAAAATRKQKSLGILCRR